MKIIKIEQNTNDWLELRKGKVTGSKKIRPKRGTARLDGFYELIADRLELPKEDKSASEQGHDLEPEAIAHFESEYNVKVDTDMMWVSSENENIAISPDGGIKIDGKYKEAVEVKCIAGKNYIRAVEEEKIPSDYSDQALQYFVVNPDLQILHFVFYDPYIKVKPMFVIDVYRTDSLQNEIDDYKDYQLELLKDVDEIVEKWSW